MAALSKRQAKILARSKMIGEGRKPVQPRHLRLPRQQKVFSKKADPERVTPDEGVLGLGIFPGGKSRAQIAAASFYLAAEGLKGSIRMKGEGRSRLVTIPIAA